MQNSLPEAGRLSDFHFWEEKKKAGIGILLTLRIISVSGSHFAGVVLALCITPLAQTEIPRNPENPGGRAGKEINPNPPFYLKFFLIVFLLSSPWTGTVDVPKRKKVIFKISTAGAAPILNLPKMQPAIFKLTKNPPKSSLHPSGEGGFAGRCSFVWEFANSSDFLGLGGTTAELAGEFYQSKPLNRRKIGL